MIDEPLINVDRLAVRRGGRLVLNGLSFALRPGGFLCVTGPNGAGKTTLLLALMRQVAIAEGRIRLAGRALSDYPQRDLAKLMGYIPQADGRPVSFSVEEFILLGRYPHWRRFSTVTAEDRRALRDAMALTGTEVFARRSVSTLSGGERQKVFIAAALAQESRILLLDEPTAFLDPRQQAEVSGLLRRLNRERGVTVMMVTHDINLGAFCADEILAIRDGASAYSGPASGFYKPDVLEDLYRIPFEVVGEGSGGPLRVFHR
ncbi:MAG: ABC transporter ATP-binding protein [Elusimicrobia bacterium]|nr:ABC transporter ATP-binding protein [Elusimicrobiota bacterium]